MYLAAAAASVFAWAMPAAAQTADYGASADCPTLISQAETRRNIPRGLLMAIAMTESGDKGRPSPFAMNIAGRSYFASSGQEMANIISANWQRGVTSIDVGCMQINLKYHGAKFARLTDLLNTPTNIEYGAGYLVSLAVESGSWKDAVMSYHNKKNPARRSWYGCRVWNNYLKINGQASGYLDCRNAPNGSTTASRETMQPQVTQQRIASLSSRAPGPLSPSAPPSHGAIEIGGQAVDVDLPRGRVMGSIALVRDGEAIPEVVNDDVRQSAFNAVRPVDWSGRVQRNATNAQSAVATQTNSSEGFGRVGK